MSRTTIGQEVGAGEGRNTGSMIAAPSTSKRRRRPSGEPPPLPHHLMTSGKLLLAGAGSVVLLLVLLLTVSSVGTALTRWDLALLGWIEDLRTDPMTRIMRGLDALGSDWTIVVLRWVTVLVLIAFKRFRHLLVFIGSLLAVGWVTTSMSLLFTRERPLGIDIIGNWEGGPFPSKPIALLAVTLIGITYSLVVPGRPRMVAKVVSTVLIFTLGAAQLYLGTAHPIDVMVGAILGAAIPVVAFRLLTPNEVFPVSYQRGKAAHLDVTGPRGEAITRALDEQLGITVLEMKPFGLAGSGGSTPLRLRVPGTPERYLFAKLYAANHLRADRWYKLGRTLLYGRLEDEASFSTVRRLIQYEDYMLRAMSDAGLNVAKPLGFVEITPEREYLLVTEFVDGAKECLEIEVNDAIIDDALASVRTLWDAGLAHRDIKPSNLLVRGESVYLIDVAFGQVRPTPWRQAVDLANMMLVLAMTTDAERVYSRALKFFTPDEVAEAFAATRGATMPSQSRSILRKDRRDLLARFRELAPKHPPIAIQRWSFRRVALTVGVLVVTILAGLMAFGNLQGAGLLTDPQGGRASFSFIQPTCERINQASTLILEAQSVPTSSLIPCLASLPLGWSFRTAEVEEGSSRLVLDSDRAGVQAAEVILTRTCDISGATEVPSDEPGTRRFEKISTLSNRYAGSRFYLFEGGCATYRFDFTGEGRTSLAEEVTLAFSFLSREEGERRIEQGYGIDFPEGGPL
jgi:tRNA A-37 threonylcarbamoyl transferase component Bud32